MTWQPIETAPKDGSRVLLWAFFDPNYGPYPKSGASTVAYWSEMKQDWLWEANGRHCYAMGTINWFPKNELPTHWMPLPEAPK
jgi:hypothetical protein